MKTNRLVMIILGLAAVSCGSKKEMPAAPAAISAASPGRVISSQVPKAVIYRMYGNATAANVPVTLAASGNGQILSYPAPGDIIGQEPVELADGYLLDRRGVGANTVFTKWTYAEYSVLKQAPDASELKAAVIPGTGVRDIHVLDMTLSQALADTAAVNREIRKF